MARALVLGGSGMLRTTAERLADAGHRVTVTCRDRAGVPAGWASRGIDVVVADRDDANATEPLAVAADVVVDGLCHGPTEAEQLVRWSSHAAVAMVSSAAVYIDEYGNHQNSDQPARWRGPIPETGPTMAYHGEPWMSRLGYGANKAEAERILLDGARAPMVLRPAKIHGPGMRNAREWSVVGPVLAGRTLLVADLPTRESTTSADDLAAVLMAHLSRPERRVVNVADADTPTPLERARTLAALVRPDARIEVVAPPIADDDPGRLPWPSNRVVDTAVMRGLGVTPRPYADSVRPAVEWLVSDEGRARMAEAAA